MGNHSSITKKVNFEDIQEVIQKKRNCLLINTLDASEQTCLISKTIPISNEEKLINTYLRKNKSITIIIYDKNAHQTKLLKKYEQLMKLGFSNVYIYPGGLFEWLCLQDIYGKDNFPTTTDELDILKYKGQSLFNDNYLLQNID
jgi:rhodanese-related sulfurtransferase